MQLTAAQQERYARHLILDDFGGEGQERLLAAAVRVHGSGPAALWAARYLAASGVGELAVEVAGWREELQSLGPWVTVRAAGEPLVHPGPLEARPREGATASESAIEGAQAALDVVRSIALGARE
jgi:hypothetical protein